MTLKEVDVLAKKMDNYKRKCSNCGHTLFIPPTRPKKICRWCGTLNYYSAKDEFKEILKKTLKKETNVI